MNKLWIAVALALFVGACCWRRTTPDPLPRSFDPAIEIIGEAVNAQDAQEKAQKTPNDSFDIDKIASNPWVIAGVFLAIQWAEIWYFNKTGRRSRTIDAAEAAMQPKLGIIQRMLYRLWRWCYFWKNKDKKDPDKEEEEKHK